jgi:NarL family two-component system response regulator LiaR
MAHTIRVLIADDHAVVRKGLRAMIEGQPDMVVVDEAEDGAVAVEKVREQRPDVAVIDMMMPGTDGLSAIEAIKRHDARAKILVLTSFADGPKVLAAVKAGALGYFLKDASPQDLLQAIRDVFDGISSLHPAIARELVLEVARSRNTVPSGIPLSARELEVLKLVAEGMRNDQIGTALGISNRTVGRHVGSILDKLRLSNRTQAALYAHRLGLTTPRS